MIMLRDIDVGKHGRQSSNEKLIVSRLFLVMSCVLTHRMPPNIFSCYPARSPGYLMKTSFCSSFQPISLKDVLSLRFLYLLYRQTYHSEFRQRLVIGQKICYHARAKKKIGFGVSHYSPDPAVMWTRVKRIQHPQYT